MNLHEVAVNILLEQGDPIILKIQKALKAKGYDLGTTGPTKDGIDGIYGNNTKAAIQQFQKANNISPTGFVGKKTAPLLGTPEMINYNKPQTAPSLNVNNAYTMSKVGVIPTSNTPSKGNTQKPQVKTDIKPEVKNDVKPQVKPEVKPEVKEKSGGGISGFLRKLSPNLTQLISTKPLSGEDFSKPQRYVIYNVIQNAIKRGQKKERGATTYADYNKEIYETLDTTKGSASLGGTTALKKSLTDPYFQVATTLGRFNYQLQPNGNYLVTDTYDFSKWGRYTVKKEEIQNMSYPQKIAYVRAKDKLSLYHAVREIAAIEHPDTAPEETKTKINVIIDPKEFTRPATA